MLIDSLQPGQPTPYAEMRSGKKDKRSSSLPTKNVGLSGKG